MAETIAISTIGPESHGQRMTLDEFARVEGHPGYIYELEKGVIVVVDVPGIPHLSLVLQVRNALIKYQLADPTRIYAVTGGGESAMRLPEMQSERHPDISVYRSPPSTPDEQPWDEWIPEIAIEIVSNSSADRDYGIKRQEYLAAGVRLYWIIDPRDRTATVLSRRADKWQEQKLDSTSLLKTPLLPGFELRLADVFSVLPG